MVWIGTICASPRHGSASDRSLYPGIGVRSLDKKIASLVRGYAKLKALEEPYEVQVDQESTARILGVRQFEPELYENNHHAGVVTGLAWTSSGGDILYIESSLSQGKGRMNITGNLGEVMKESASIALAYIRSHAGDWNIKPELFEHSDIHIHVPEGATPKDGPSAGITMLTSLLSTYTQRKIRKKLAMTGEITLRGKVLPVGGIKEKSWPPSVPVFRKSSSAKATARMSKKLNKPTCRT